MAFDDRAKYRLYFGCYADQKCKNIHREDANKKL